MTRAIRSFRRGFTLVEVLSAVLLTALLMGVSARIISQLSRISSGSSETAQAVNRAHAASNAIARDLLNVVRTGDLSQTRVRLTPGGTESSPLDELLLVINTQARVRGEFDSPEGYDFEVGYKLLGGADGPELWRRVDPALDSAPDAGGVASRVASGVVSLRFEALSVDTWAREWDSDADGLPHAVRVTLEAQGDGGVRKRVARRVVALDRVPIPPPETEDDEGTTP